MHLDLVHQWKKEPLYETYIKCFKHYTNVLCHFLALSSIKNFPTVTVMRFRKIPMKKLGKNFWFELVKRKDIRNLNYTVFFFLKSNDVDLFEEG